jgi:L-tyrosine isonitrile synthase
MSDRKTINCLDPTSSPFLQEPTPGDTSVLCGSPGRSPPSDFVGSSARRSVKRTPLPNPEHQKGKVAAEKVMHAFNTWAFKREQPDNPPLMLQTVSHSIALGDPISFVTYWGKGPRGTIGAPDVECLGYIASMARRISDVYPPGAAVKLIFTDTHAGLNGHSQPSIQAYFAEIDACARTFGFEHCWISDLTRAAEELVAKDLLDDPAPDDDLLERLVTSAAKWYHGDETPQHAALAYYKMNMIEKRAVEIAFPHSIFITFNGGRLRNLFPKRLPVFYMYSLRRGVSVKPWFITADSSH